MTAVLLLFLGMAAISLVHELGHAAAARGCGFHITDIGIGLGPALLSFERRGVRWMIGPIPLGGFVRVAELAPENGASPSDGAPWFSARSVTKRAVVIGAGPAANYVLATLVTLTLTIGWGLETGHARGLRVVSVDEDTRRAGLAVRDLVLHVNGHALGDLRSLSSALADSSEVGLAVVSLQRGNLPLQIRLPRLRARSGAWGLGAAYVIEPELRRVGIGDALASALATPLLEARTLLAHAAGVLAPRTTAASRPLGRSLGRPLGVVGLADRVHATRDWNARRVLMLGISLSVAMGLFNLLPFPGLDGGRLCIEAVQVARQRRMAASSLITVQVAGSLILLAAWLLLTAFEIYLW